MLKRDFLKLSLLSSVQASLGSSALFAQETPRKGGTLTVAMDNDAKSLDPTFQINFSERQPLYLIFNTLLGLNPDFTIKAELAERWETSEDGKTLTLSLRKGVKFHDGTPFDASVAKWNIDRRMDPAIKSPSRQQLAEAIEVVEAKDPETLVIRMKNAAPSLLGMLAQREGFMISPASVQKYGEGVGQNPVGTGPFIFKNWAPGQQIVVERNPDYWEPGKPYLDKIVFMLIANSAISIPRLMTKEVDFVGALSPIDIRTLQKQTGINLLPNPGSRWLSLQMRVDQPPYNNPKLRQAVAHALDRKRMVDIIMDGKAAIAEGFTPPGLWWFDESLKSYSFDQARARALLAEIGDDAKVNLVLSVQPVPIYQQIGQLAQEQLKAVGLNVTIQPLSMNEWYPQLLAGRVSFLTNRWTVRPDPDGLFTYLFHSKSGANSSRYNNPEVDRLLDEARGIHDQAHRIELYKEAQAHMTRDLPFIPLFFSREFAAMRENVRNFVWVADEIPRFREVWKAY